MQLHAYVVTAFGHIAGTVYGQKILQLAYCDTTDFSFQYKAMACLLVYILPQQPW